MLRTMEFTRSHIDGYKKKLYFQYREINQLPSVKAIGRAFEILAGISGNYFSVYEVNNEIRNLTKGTEFVKGEWVYNEDKTVNQEQLQKFSNTLLFELFDTAIDNINTEEFEFDWTYGQVSHIEIIDDVISENELYYERERLNALEKSEKEK